MEKTEELLLQKTRSIPAVIRDGYRLYTGNFKRLFRASWIAALIYALCFAMMMSTIINDMLGIIVLTTSYGLQVLNITDFTAEFVKTGASVLLFIVAMLALAPSGTLVGHFPPKAFPASSDSQPLAHARHAGRWSSLCRHHLWGDSCGHRG